MTFHYEKADGIATITLDNPPVNVLTPELHKDLLEILRDFNADPEIRCGIWTAAGDRAFCAGDDVKTPRRERSFAEIAERHLTPRREGDGFEYPGWEAEVLALPRLKPMIAAVNGVCLGQGMIYLLLLTDLRLATPNARFGLPEIAYGMPGASAATRLGRQIPHVLAMQLALTGEMIDAETAARGFLINEVVPPADLMPRAGALASRIAAHPPIAVRAEIEAYQRTQDMTRADALAYAGNLYHLVRATQDRSTPPLARKEPNR
ncbi:MAG: enoyl-CoA hydratase/isomerase family protein [Pararhodobacter sp.]|nr:enoyl-CoA hydratase/isomerase family protein [Pararhodobacter sp.]